MRQRTKLCILIILCIAPVYSYAQQRWRPGGSQYFSSTVQKQLQKRDIMRETLYQEIQKHASGDHAKDLALRAYLYEYCGEKAQEILNENGIQLKKTTSYDTYNFLQTQLYQSLQPTVTKARLVLGMPAISFETVLQHLQSQDDVILYFYRTLPQRYDDVPVLDAMGVLKTSLQSYKNANNNYPESLDDLFDYGFMPLVYKKTISEFAYTAHNRPYISLVELSYTKPYKPIRSWYVLAAPVSYVLHANIETSNSAAMKLMQDTLQYYDRQDSIKKHALLATSGSVLWNIMLGK